MNLSEQFCGIESAPLSDRERYCELLMSRHPDLRKFEALKEWHQ